ncbi:DUF1801 domain-containing protein [Paeniglutamicibacter antarcticus]
MNPTRTVPTHLDPREFIATVPNQRRSADVEVLLELMEEASSQPATMWGPSIIGFGSYHYMYDSGRKGDACPIGFSPRSSNLALYGLTIGPNAEQLLQTLGKHKRGASCLYVNKLEDIDLEVLAQLAREGYRHMMDTVHDPS